jgi:hypothetical protein
MLVPTVVIPGPAIVAAPASPGARLKSGTRRFGHAVWDALVLAGKRRAVQKLRIFVAAHGDRFPEVAAQLQTLEAEAGLRRTA